MKKHFYSAFVSIEEIVIELRSMELSDEEVEQLTQMAEETLHHEILNLVLSELNEDDKKVSLLHVVENNHDEALKHVVDRIERIEERIISTAKELKTAFLDDINEARKE